jgi:hypothetical protein
MRFDAIFFVKKGAHAFPLSVDTRKMDRQDEEDPRSQNTYAAFDKCHNGVRRLLHVIDSLIQNSFCLVIR